MPASGNRTHPKAYLTLHSPKRNLHQPKFWRVNHIA